MEFDEHEEQEVEVGIQLPPVENSGRVRKTGGGGGYRYRECLKNHAVGIGGYAVDGCGEFLATGDDGTLDALICAGCNCHRNFHRKEIEGQQRPLHHHYITQPPYYHHHQHQQQQQMSAGYLQLTPSPSPAMLGNNQRPLALPLTEDLEEISNPSSSGGGGGGIGGSKKRFRTKFTLEQKDRMLAFSETLGWRIQKEDEGAVQQFCAETGIKRSVLKVWMHNNKHTIGKKP